MTDRLPDIFIERTFDVPRIRLFAAFADADQLAQWWGPKDFAVSRHTLDFRPGGLYHYCLLGPGGAEMWGKFVYREIRAPEQIVLVSSFSDAAGHETRHPLAPGWPLRTLSVFNFDERGTDGSRLATGWAPLAATPDEHRVFEAAHDGMIAGWSGTLDRLEAYLSQGR